MWSQVLKSLTLFLDGFVESVNVFADISPPIDSMGNLGEVVTISGVLGAGLVYCIVVFEKAYSTLHTQEVMDPEVKRGLNYLLFLVAILG